MRRNAIQFQRGLSDTEFAALYGTEDQCWNALYRWRWPDGFRCPICGSGRCSRIQTRMLLQCSSCRRQTSITAGTIFQSTHLPLTTWFRGIHLVTSAKTGISALELRRRLGISYTAAWKMHHKIMQVMLERDTTQRIGGPSRPIQMDDAYLGGESSDGTTGRGASGKTPFVIAVETNEKGHPLRIKLAKVAAFSKKEIGRFARHLLASGSSIVTDGLNCFPALSAEGHTHHRIVCGGGKAAVQRPEFRWVNTVLGNIKGSITGTFRAIGDTHVPRYLAQFQWRFNRRFNLANLIPRFAVIAVRTPPMPYSLLKLAEAGW